ncbi:MAG TPA: DUF4375 domain-containing protein [Tepidisphaeraceae bacterium]|jgi:hypothetical protein|nr:DUF4375 domain-containing protein [Tepidisphaeraceae bacterium]
MDKNTLLIKLSESPRTDFGRVAFAKQPEAQQVFSAVWASESEVNNGGFRSYLTGSEADTAAFAPKALRIVGATKCAAIVDRALQIGPSGDISEVDDEFMAYPDNLTELLFAYVASHPEVFGEIDNIP